MIKFPLLTPYDISENRFPLYQHLKSLLFVKKLLPSTVLVWGSPRVIRGFCGSAGRAGHLLV